MAGRNLICSLGLSASLVSMPLLSTSSSLVYAQDDVVQDPVVQDAPVIRQNCDSCDGNNRVANCDDYAIHNCSDSFWTRKTLTGDWCGLRTNLQQRGINFSGNSTHFGFGVDGGVHTPVPPVLKQGDTFKYTGRGEYDLLFDLEKFGGMPYGKLLVRAEHWYGEYGNVSLRTGTFSPAVFPAALPPTPNDQGVPYMSNFLITQPLSKKFVVFAGKKDVLGDVDQDAFAGGDGTDQFVNQAFVANPAFLLGLPYSSFTAGFAMPREWGMMKCFVYDPQDRIRDFFRFEDLFSQGVIVGGEVSAKTNYFDRAGDVHVGGMWKHVDLTDLSFAEPPPGVYPYPTVPNFATLSDSYTIFCGADHYLVEFGDPKNRGFGLFGRASISDGNPTPLRYFLSAGLGGYSPLNYQRGDTFGMAWYYVGASNEFGPIPQAIFGPRDGTGVETFYNVQVTPFLNVTPDIQFLRPEASAIADDSVVYGLRVSAKF